MLVSASVPLFYLPKNLLVSDINCNFAIKIKIGTI